MTDKAHGQMVTIMELAHGFLATRMSELLMNGSFFADHGLYSHKQNGVL